MDPFSSSQAHPETMDFLSSAWCNFAIQALQPNDLQDQSIVLLENPIMKFDDSNKMPVLKMDNSVKMEEPLPPWKSKDVKSWIWMQQAMHPELNYNRKKWVTYPKLPWKIIPFKITSIKKWLKEIKLKKKEEGRLQRAEIHAAISVAGVAAALAAMAAAEKNSPKEDHDDSTTTKESALASAAALVAAQCAQVAESIGATREELSSVIRSAMSGTNANDVLTLTAAASTSLRGAAALKARRGGCMKTLNASAPVLPMEENNRDEFDFEKSRSILAKGAELNIETSDGKCRVRLVSVVLNNEAKVILKTRKLNILNTFTSMRPSIILDMHAELYKYSEDEEEETETCYLLVLTTNHGAIKIDMSDDYQRYKTWTMTINHMLMLSTSFTRYELQFYKN